MNKEQSIVVKTESALNDLLDLWHRRKLVCVIVLAVIVLPVGFTLFLHFVAVPKLEAQVRALQTEKGEAEQQRDKAELQLSPFLAVAELGFPDSPADKRLDLLLSKLDKAIVDIQSTTRGLLLERSLDSHLKQALIAKLKAIAPLDVKVSCILGDQEALSFATQLYNVFEQAGWKTVDGSVTLAVYLEPTKYLAISSGKEPSLQLQQAFAPLFDSLGYQRDVVVNKELAENLLEIIVGSK